MKKTILPLLALFALALGSCFNPPDFPHEPEIAFVSISGQKIREPLLGNLLDSITIVINFKDGNGDLGLSPSDTLPPFQAFNVVNGQRVLNFFHHNYHLSLKRKIGTRIEDVVFLDGGQIRGRLPRLSDTSGPIEGELKYGQNLSVGILGSPLKPFDTIFFQVRIVDRELNVSNTIETNTLVLGDY